MTTILTIARGLRFNSDYLYKSTQLFLQHTNTSSRTHHAAGWNKTTVKTPLYPLTPLLFPNRRQNPRFHKLVARMSDDASYSAFLDKANSNPSASHPNQSETSTSQSKSKFDPTSNDSAVPKALHKTKEYTYTSETDSPFEPVLFNYGGAKLPSTSEFEKILGAKGHSNVEELSIKDFDPREEYSDVISMVKEAGQSKDVKIFRVEVGKTRVEYYIIALGEQKLVGAVAKAVES